MKIKYLLPIMMSTFYPSSFFSQALEVEGNALFTTAASTNVDLKNSSDNTNAVIRFGDNNAIKASAGFNGVDDVFQISMGNTFSSDDLTISPTGNIGINTLPSNHRMVIQHNSTSGTGGSAQLTLRENNTSDYARLRFENFGDDGLWTIAGRATEGSANLNFFHHDGTNFANVLSIDGDDSYVGILTLAPEGYLHIKQESSGIHALLLENDVASGGEKWAFQVGTDNLDVYLDDFLIGSFNAITGAYSFFGPPPSASFAQPAPSAGILDKVAKLMPVSYARETNQKEKLSLNPYDVEKIDPSWVVRSEDGTQVGLSQHTMSIVAIQSIQEQQSVIEEQNAEIKRLENEEIQLKTRLDALENTLKSLSAVKKNMN